LYFKFYYYNGKIRCGKKEFLSPTILQYQSIKNWMYLCPRKMDVIPKMEENCKSTKKVNSFPSLIVEALLFERRPKNEEYL